MPEFIFGSMSSEAWRVAYHKQRRSALWHEHRTIPLAPLAGDKPRLEVTVGLDSAVERLECHLIEPERRTIALAPISTEWDVINWAYFQTWTASLPPYPEGTVVRYRIEAHLRDGQRPLLADNGATFSYLVGDPAPPDWAAEAIIYQIFPDRFCPDADKGWLQTADLEKPYGGTLKGIIGKLDYIADLGFNCIWLNPFFPDQTYHGYHATDYFSVNPRLGNEADIRQLVDQAHARGIRLILDFVANHWGSRHPTFQAAQKDRQSEYHHWYRWKQWPDEYETYFNVRDLPQINVDYPAAREHLLSAARHWLVEYAFDGLRLDYAMGPSHDFWTDLRVAVNQAKPEAWIFGEVVDTPDRQRSYWGQMHGCLDFILQQALRELFGFGEISLPYFDALLERHEAFFPTAYSRPSFLDNHDVDRFLWLVGGDKRKLKLAALCQFTLAGPPIVYYGTEVGLSQEFGMNQPGGRHSMAEARLPMVWGDDQDADLLAYYRWLIDFRRQHPVLWRGRRQTVHLDAASGTYAYIRSGEDQAVTVCLNLSDEDRSVAIAGHVFELAPWSGDVRVETFEPVK
ncbi:MAG: alpha-amylase family glycosyl hydrolase [Chloroflexota bacterium]|jgi:glycosidase